MEQDESTSIAARLVLPDPSEPDAALAAVVALRRLADRLEFAAVRHAIGEGWTWAQVAQALGVTRQAAHKRHAHRLREREGDSDDPVVA